MKKALINSLGCFVIIVSFAGLAAAGDNFSIPVSCTIPAIPGVNVPLIQDETVVNDKETPASSAEEQSPSLIEQENQGQEPLMLVKTLYDR